jgi:hypothetical protein
MYLEQFCLDFPSAFRKIENLSVTAELKLRDSHRFVVVLNGLFRDCRSNHRENLPEHLEELTTVENPEGDA